MDFKEFKEKCFGKSIEEIKNIINEHVSWCDIWLASEIEFNTLKLVNFLISIIIYLFVLSQDLNGVDVWSS